MTKITYEIELSKPSPREALINLLMGEGIPEDEAVYLMNLYLHLGGQGKETLQVMKQDFDPNLQKILGLYQQYHIELNSLPKDRDNTADIKELEKRILDEIGRYHLS